MAEVDPPSNSPGPAAVRHLLILDLDETLIHAAESPLEHPCDLRVGPYFVYRRPFVAEFLEWALERFDVAVWSSASGLYVKEIVRGLFPDPERLKFVWASGRCTQRLHPEWLTYYWLKDLRKVKRAGYPLERVLIIDDSPEKLERHYGNLLRVAPFTGQPDDTELRDLLPFLDWLRTQDNLRRIEKRRWRAFSVRAGEAAGADGSPPPPGDAAADPEDPTRP